MNNISAMGSTLRLIASKTFPQGITIDQFSNDEDPFGFDSVDIGSFELDINGNPIVFARAVPIPMTLSVLPGSESSVDMATLFSANRATLGRRGKFDEISIVVAYPDGSQKIVSKGSMVSGVPGVGATTDGKLKPLNYGFMFASSS